MKNKKYVLNFCLLSLSIIVSLILVETVYRFTHWESYKNFLAFQEKLDKALQEEITFHEGDSTLGWHPRPGNYSISPYDGKSDSNNIQVTILEDGTRFTGNESSGGSFEHYFLFIGGSYTQGYAISDHETFVYKLQTEFPSSKFINLGAAGYGTYQSFLNLNRYLQSHPTIKDNFTVFYCFISDHEYRNVAAPSYLRSLNRFGSRGFASLPYCELNDIGNLIQFAPISNNVLLYKISEYSQVFKLFCNLYQDKKGAYRVLEKRKVTFELINRINKLAKNDYGGDFVFVNLFSDENDRNEYKLLLGTNKITYLDCVDQRIFDEEMKVPNEGHPNGRMNSIWAEHLSGYIKSFE